MNLSQPNPLEIMLRGASHPQPASQPASLSKAPRASRATTAPLHKHSAGNLTPSCYIITQLQSRPDPSHQQARAGRCCSLSMHQPAAVRLQMILIITQSVHKCCSDHHAPPPPQMVLSFPLGLLCCSSFYVCWCLSRRVFLPWRALHFIRQSNLIFNL